MRLPKTLILAVTIFLLLPVTNTQATTSDYGKQSVDLINTQRQLNHLPSLNTSDKLTQAALKHNQLMNSCSKTYGVNSCFAHQVSQLSEASLLNRISQTGYNPNAVAENIAWGYTSPSSVVNGWMNSSGHRATILSSTYKDIGCSLLDASNGNYSGMYWTCDFGESFSTQPQSTPTPSPSPTPTPTSKPSPSPSPKISPSPSQTPSPNPSTPWYCIYFNPSSKIPGC